MRHLVRILAFSALVIVAMIPITGIRLSPDATQAVGFIAGIVAFVSAAYLALSLIKTGGWVMCALIFMGAGAVGGTVSWAIAGRDQSLVGSALLGALAAFAAYLPDSWIVGTISGGRKRA